LIRTRHVLALEDAPSALGRFVIRQNGMIVGGGLISMEGFKDLRALNRVPKSTHLQTGEAAISEAERAAKYGHSGLIVWLTGLSSSGKSTLANGVARRLFDKGYQVSLLDGDHLRAGLNRDLGFSATDRRENIRRAGEVAALMAGSGLITIAAFISPTRDDRDLARAAAPSLFHLVHVKATLAACEKRDVKGLYAKARRGDIAEFTGISAPYDEPYDAELIIDTEAMSAQNAIEQLYRYIEKHALIT
jgi:bifunctional enzyme CysN/CysC